DNIFNITKTAGTNIIGGNWTAGNWWWNYLGDDNDGDGIGDTMLPHNNDYAPIIIAPSAYENCDMTFSTLDIEAGRTYNFTNCNLTFGTVSVKQYGKLYIQDSVVDAESSPWSLSASTNSIVRIKDSTLNNCIISSSSDLFSLTGNTLSDCNNAVTFTGDEAIITGNTIGSGGLAVSITGASKVTLNTNTFTGSNKKIYLSGSSNAAISDNTLDEIEMRGGLYNNISDMSMNKLIFEPNSSMAWNLTFPSLEPRIAGGRNDVWDITSYSGLNMSGSDNVVRDSYVLGVVYFQYGYKENNTLRGSTIVNGSIYPQSQNPTAPKLNIINNTINFTASEGIDNWMTSQAAWSVISGNKFYSKNPTAIDTCIKWKGSDNIISDNRFNCTRGLRLGGTAPTKRNNITGNYFTGGHYGLLFKSDNTINNSIWNNYFDNEYDVYFHCNATYLEQNNRWNITKVQGNNIIGGSWMGGNFWHDYDGYDSNGDGLGDSDLPHWKDWLPLTTRGPPDDGDDSGGDDDLNKIVTPGNKTSKNETEEEPEVKENQDDNSTEIYIPEVDENESVSVDLPNEKQLVVQIVITPSKRVPGIHIVVKKLPEKPADVDRKHGAVYQYLKIDKNVTDEEIKEAVIKFVVDREWLEKNGLNPDKIKLVRWNRGKWEKLPTEREVDDGDYFDVNDDEVTVKKSGKIKIKVLGSAFSARGENIPVYAWGMIGGGGYEELFGGANVNTDKEAGYYSQEFDVSSGDKVHIKAKGRLTISTEDGGKNVIVLRNGDTPPYFKPFGDQPEIASFLSSVMDPDTGKVSIGPNDVLYLFELWTTKASSSAFDMQDLIVLVSYEAPEEDSYTYSSTSEGFSYFAIIADMPEITEASVSGPTGYFIFPTTEAVLAGVVIVIGVGLLVSRRKMLKRKKKVRWLWS
ncbi:MAG: NosD domain-containing protein, partial [Candidatus Aenigmatarchaeota archaeon]